MGCIAGKTQISTSEKEKSSDSPERKQTPPAELHQSEEEQPSDSPLKEKEQTAHLPPDEQTPQLKQKEAALRNLWLPGSIWTGTITVNGVEAPWEVHVERNSTPNSITAKRVANFMQLTFVKANVVDFSMGWEELRDEKGNHCGWDEVITFEWLDDEYRLFADTLNGIIDLREKRIEGLVVDNKTKNVGVFDFCRLMANERFSEETPIPSSNYNLISDSERTSRFMGAVFRTSERSTMTQRSSMYTGEILRVT